MSPSDPSHTVAAPITYGRSLHHIRLQARQAFFGMSQSFDAFAPCGVQCGGRGTCFGKGCYKPGRAAAPVRTPMRSVSSSTSNSAADTRGGGGGGSGAVGAMPPPPTPTAPPSGRASRAAKLAAQSVLSRRSGSDSEGSEAEGEVSPSPTPRP